MDAVIIYESLTGTTQRAARLIGDGLYDHRIGSQLFQLGAIDPAAIDAADVVIIGTWTDGLLIVGQKPAKTKKLRELPRLDGKPCFVFCTYAIHPGKTLEKLSKIVTELGGTVLGGLTVRRDHVDDDIADFVAGAAPVIAALPPRAAPPAPPADDPAVTADAETERRFMLGAHFARVGAGRGAGRAGLHDHGRARGPFGRFIAAAGHEAQQARHKKDPGNHGCGALKGVGIY